MGDKWKKLIGEKRWEKLFRRDNLVVLVLAGILLFLVALPVRRSDGTEEADEKSGRPTGFLEGFSVEDPAQGTETEMASCGEAAYVLSLENRLTEALEKMAEVGKVKVMITLRSSGERIVEKERPVSRSSILEEDVQGGNRTVDESEHGESVVYSRDGNNSVPYVVKTYAPEIEGVLIVAEGSGSGTVNRTVTEIAQALFGVESHKIKVVRMETKTK